MENDEHAAWRSTEQPGKESAHHHCLLEARFTDASSGKLKAYYLPRRREYDNPPSRAGRVEDYIEYDPQAHEDYWSTEVENHLPAAFAAVDDGTIPAPYLCEGVQGLHRAALGAKRRVQEGS